MSLDSLMTCSRRRRQQARASNSARNSDCPTSRPARLSKPCCQPPLAAGLASNAQKPGGIEALLGALSKGSHDRYLDDPKSLGNADTVADGNAILGHLLGSKDMSRAVAGAAAQKTGLSDQVMKMALPVIASMVMSQLSKKSKSKASAGGSAFGLDDLMDMIGGAAEARRRANRKAECLAD